MQLRIFALLMHKIMKRFFIPFILFFTLINIVAAQEVILKKDKYVLRESGKTYTGIYKEYDSENRLVSATCINNGLLDDSTTLFYASGVKKEVRAYKEGIKHGTWTNYSENGKKTAEASFVNGKKDGNWYVWDEQGIMRYEMFYVKGEKKGTWIIRDENGTVISREEFK